MSSEQTLSILGSGIILFFFYLRHIRIMMFLLFVAYGTISMIFDLAIYPFKLHNCTIDDGYLIYGICLFNENCNFSKISSNLFFINIQLWLGFVMCVFWLIGLKLISSFGMKKDREIDASLESASDYTIRIDNLPYG